MSFVSADRIKEDFRRSLEECGVVDALTRVLVSLYDAPVRPQPADALLWVSDAMAGSGPAAVAASLRAENARLQSEVERLRAQVERAAPAAAAAEPKPE